VHQEFRILRRILNVAVKKRQLAINPCSGVEFRVAVSAATRKPHYLTASEQERLERVAPVYLRNIIVIMVEMGLRPYRELMPMHKAQVDLANGIVHLPESKTANRIADMPMSDRARAAFASQTKESDDSDLTTCFRPHARERRNRICATCAGPGTERSNAPGCRISRYMSCGTRSPLDSAQGASRITS
jgi:hypothetical protein